MNDLCGRSVRKVRDFLEANRQSPVEYGSVTGPEGDPTGCFYRLENKQTFTLTIAELRVIGNPRWSYEEQAA